MTELEKEFYPQGLIRVCSDRSDAPIGTVLRIVPDGYYTDAISFMMLAEDEKTFRRYFFYEDSPLFEWVYKP